MFMSVLTGTLISVYGNKVNFTQLMEGGPECWGIYGRWARVQGNLWKVGQSAGELMDGGHEFRQSLRPKMPKNGIWQLFIYIFGCFIFIFIFLLNIFENAFRTRYSSRKHPQ